MECGIPITAYPTVTDRLASGSQRPERSVGRHGRDSASPNSCLEHEPASRKAGPMRNRRMSFPSIFVGIDVAKAHLDIALRPTGTRWTVTNAEAGITDLAAQLHAISPALIVLEATGGLPRAVVAALAAAALPVVVVTPRQGRDFAKATGQLAQTDALDARALAHFAEAIRPAPRPVADAQTEARRALLARRRQLIAMRTAEQNRLGSAPRRLHADIEAHITGPPCSPGDY